MKRVFVVDDDPFNLEVAEAYLKKHYQVSGFVNAESCFHRLSSELPDLLLLDNLMPGMNGVDLCKKLKSEPDYCSLPIIIVSAYADDQHIIEANACGADDYLTKPFFEKELIDLVGKYLPR